MGSLREFLIAQSTLPAGNKVRDHIDNPSTGGQGTGVVLIDGLEVLMDDCYEVEVDKLQVVVELAEELIIEIETEEYEVEVC